MFRNLKLGAKIGIGFGLLIAIACSLGGLAVYNMGNVEAESTILANEHVPVVELAGNVERAWLGTMYAIRGYNLTGDDEYLTQGRENFELLKEHLNGCTELANKSEHLTELKSVTAECLTNAEEYDRLCNQTVEKNALIAQARKDLAEASTQYMQNCLAFQDGQTESMQEKISKDASLAALGESLDKITIVTEIINLGEATIAATFEFQAMRSPKIIEDARQNFIAMDEKFAALREFDNNETDSKRIDATKEAADAVAVAMNNLLSNWVALQELVQREDVAGEAVLDGVRKMAQNGIKGTDEVARGAVELLSASSTIMIIGLIVALIVGIVIAFFIAQGISKPVTALAVAADGISKGDVNQKVEYESKDEVGQLSDAFRALIDYMNDLSGAAESIARNDLTVMVEPKSAKDVLGNAFKTMIRNLSVIITQLGGSSHEVASAATEVSSAAEQISRTSQEQEEQVVQVTAAIEEMTATIVESSKNAGEATDGAKGASDTADTGGQIVQETIEGMNRISTAVRESAEDIDKLAQSAEQIGEIVGVIDDIADQTNLLALNAAIEAARAGEHGRGFAVVADEVRKLAERTGKATGEITDMIKGIQQGTTEAVTTMKTGIKEIDTGRELADKAGTSLNEVATGAQSVMDMIRQIATATEEQSAAAEQISRNIESVSTASRESASGATQAATAAEQLSRNAEGLQEIVGRFKVSTSSEMIETETEEIVEAG